MDATNGRHYQMPMPSPLGAVLSSDCDRRDLRIMRGWAGTPRSRHGAESPAIRACSVPWLFNGLDEGRATDSEKESFNQNITIAWAAVAGDGSSRSKDGLHDLELLSTPNAGEEAHNHHVDAFYSCRHRTAAAAAGAVVARLSCGRQIGGRDGRAVGLAAVCGWTVPYCSQKHAARRPRRQTGRQPAAGQETAEAASWRECHVRLGERLHLGRRSSIDQGQQHVERAHKHLGDAGPVECAAPGLCRDRRADRKRGPSEWAHLRDAYKVVAAGSAKCLLLILQLATGVGGNGIANTHPAVLPTPSSATHPPERCHAIHPPAALPKRGGAINKTAPPPLPHLSLGTGEQMRKL